MRENTGTVKLVLKDKNTNTILAETSLDVAAVTPDMKYNWNMDPVVDDVENKELILSIMSDSKSGEGISVYCNSTLNTGDKALYRNGEAISGCLAFQTTLISRYFLGQYFWVIMASFAILFGCYYVYSCVAATKGKFTIGMVMHGVWCRYGF